ncbi:hypothetical protein D1AOALGA4SA_736 [Olavius algarvensis Delta 1 endosymbiont]|nr:hypothetical protein D1AOALGA4SA_736 [Olavius algarvensis Delta 1 endosymbiont]
MYRPAGTTFSSEVSEKAWYLFMPIDAITHTMNSTPYYSADCFTSFN